MAVFLISSAFLGQEIGIAIKKAQSKNIGSTKIRLTKDNTIYIETPTGKPLSCFRIERMQDSSTCEFDFNTFQLRKLYTFLNSIEEQPLSIRLEEDHNKLTILSCIARFG